jgi:hypothetical protein
LNPSFCLVARDGWSRNRYFECISKNEREGDSSSDPQGSMIRLVFAEPHVKSLILYNDSLRSVATLSWNCDVFYRL